MPAGSTAASQPRTRSGRPGWLRHLRAGAWWLLLGVFVLSVAVWIDSYAWCRQYSWGDRYRGNYTFVTSSNGSLFLEQRANCDIDQRFTRNHQAAYRYGYHGYGGGTFISEFMGFGYYNGTRYVWCETLYPVTTYPPLTDWRWQKEPYGMLRLPYWPVVLLGAVALPFIPRRVRRWRAARRARRNLCRFCAYNLTGNTSGVCPECGSSVRV